MAFYEPGKLEIWVRRFLGHRVLARVYRDYARSLGLKGGEWVLEFGSGPGGLSRQLVSLLTRGHLTCVDLSRNWMASLQQILHHPNVDFRRGDITRLEIPDQSYHAVVIHFVLHDVDQPLRGPSIQALARKLKPGGRLFIREPQKESHGISPGEVRDFMAAAGLVEVSSREIKSRLAGEVFEGVFGKE
jgi:ubiquinone/menaquinone biosynthesis C-methylase UbiE